MSYIVSARKYRPQTFDELVGQEHIANTLKNAITKERVGHAYLFAGPRGIGKTSAARIFAKALNCEHGPTPAPCGACTFCREIQEGTALDLVEIDGASNRRIDEVRQIRENVRFVPSSSRYKIYIIDEVHMLTHEAFNALLKTLEEPPDHVVFLFATTEINKVPQTIRSRCQQFIFKRIPIPLIIDMLERIAKDIGVEADARALFWMARYAQGSMRDAESILDQMASYAEGTIKEEDVFFVQGRPAYQSFHHFARAIADEDTKSCLSLFDALVRDGTEVPVVISGLIEYFRDLYVLSVDSDAEGLIDLPPDDRTELSGLLPRFTSTDIRNILVLLSRAYTDTRNCGLAYELFEVTLIKCAHFRDAVHPSTLVRRMEELGKKLGGTGNSARDPAGSPARGPEPGDAAADETGRIIEHLTGKRRAIAECLIQAKSCAMNGDSLNVRYEQKERMCYDRVSERGTRRFIEDEMRKLLNRELRLVVSIDEEVKEAGGDLSEDTAKVVEIFKGDIISNNNSGGK